MIFSSAIFCFFCFETTGDDDAGGGEGQLDEHVVQDGLTLSKVNTEISLIVLRALMYQKPGMKLAIFRTVSRY